MSIIQRSAAVQGDFEVVVLTDGTQHDHYDGLDVAGKLVLTDGDLQPRLRPGGAATRRGWHPVRRHGDFRARPRPAGSARRTPVYLVLVGRGRAALLWLCPDAAPGPPAAPERCPCGCAPTWSVRSTTAPSRSSAAFIPGQSDDEVLVVSHLCHPQPSANDNASGAAATIEIAATLRRLIDDGTLGPPMPRDSLPLDAGDDRHLRLSGQQRGTAGPHRGRGQPGHGGPEPGALSQHLQHRAAARGHGLLCAGADEAVVGYAQRRQRRTRPVRS